MAALTDQGAGTMKLHLKLQTDPTWHKLKKTHDTKKKGNVQTISNQHTRSKQRLKTQRLKQDENSNQNDNIELSMITNQEKESVIMYVFVALSLETPSKMSE